MPGAAAGEEGDEGAAPSTEGSGTALRAMPASAARRPASERAPGGPRQAALQGAARRPAPSDLSGGCDTLAQVFAH